MVLVLVRFDRVQPVAGAQGEARRVSEYSARVAVFGQDEQAQIARMSFALEPAPRSKSALWFASFTFHLEIRLGKGRTPTAPQYILNKRGEVMKREQFLVLTILASLLLLFQNCGPSFQASSSAGLAPSSGTTPSPEPSPATTPAPLPTPDPIPMPVPPGQISAAQIMYSGHSLLNSPLPEMMTTLAQGLGTAHYWNKQNIPGSPLRVRTRGSNPTDPTFGGYRTGTNRDGSNMNIVNELRNPATIGPRRYDTLMITERHDILGVLHWEDTVRYLRHFHERLIEGNPKATTYFYESWLDMNKANPTAWLNYEMAASTTWRCAATRINHSLAATGRTDRLKSLPAGLALVTLVTAALQSPGVPGVTGGSTTETLNRLFSDNVHLTDLGWYYISLVTYAMVYQRSPVGAAPPAGVSQQTATALQNIAAQFVTTYQANQRTLSPTECRDYMVNTFCAAYHNFRNEAGQIQGCRNLYMTENNSNPFYYNAATDNAYWFPAPP